MSYRLGVDVGGTFTDLLLINEETGETHTAKVPSTPEDSSLGVLNGIARICDESGIDPQSVSRVMHGTTVATNAVLTGKGARVGLVTTEGYEDTLQVVYLPKYCPFLNPIERFWQHLKKLVNANRLHRSLLDLITCAEQQLEWQNDLLNLLRFTFSKDL